LGIDPTRYRLTAKATSIDQIVLSAERFMNAPPGPGKLDSTIVQ
jgi:hypothetical protein